MRGYPDLQPKGPTGPPIPLTLKTPFTRLDLHLVVGEGILKVALPVHPQPSPSSLPFQLADFGLFTFQGGSTSLARSEELALAYLAPELLADGNRRASMASDVYR